MYFRANFKKNQEKPKVLSKTLEKTQGPQKKAQEPKIASENPRSWEKTQAVATLAAADNLSARRRGQSCWFSFRLFIKRLFKSTRLLLRSAPDWHYRAYTHWRRLVKN